MLEVWFGGIVFCLIVGSFIALMLLFFGAVEDELPRALVFASESFAGGLIVGLLWPLGIVVVILAIPAFVLWGGFNIARAVKHGSLDREDWR